MPDLLTFNASGKEVHLFAGEGNGAFRDAGNVDPAAAISVALEDGSKRDGIPIVDESRVIRKVSGDGHSSPASIALPEPLVVEVSEQSGLPVAGELVIFSRVAGEADLADDGLSLTDGQGEASGALSLGAKPGSNLVAAAIPSGKLAVFGSATTLSPDDFFNRLKSMIARLPLDESGMREQQTLLEEAENRLKDGNEIGAVKKLRGSINLLTKSIPD